ncbi:MAG: LLM class F420-dependent oxidoreductase [Actinobacteria bacterium]|nr:LLM class F420-dependent oxidoreductase [Actinomycetota bacterium]
MTTMGVTAASLMTLGPDTATRTAHRAVERGYTSFWTAETVSLEAFSLLGAIGQVAPTLDLGTGVLALQLRTPPLLAMAAATLQALQPERRVMIGIGISSPTVTARWHGTPYGDRPLAHVREFITLLGSCLSGEKVDFAGDFHQVRGFRLGVPLGDRRPEIVLGALGPEMLAVAGELADGVLLNYLPASHVPWSLEQVRRGIARAGRSPDDVTTYAYVHAGVCDRDQAVDKARRDLFSYAVVDSYAANFTRAGYGDAVAEVRAAHAARDREAALAAVSDAMIDGIDILGDADTVTAGVQAYVDAGVDHPVLMPLPWGPDRTAVIADTMDAAIRAV